MNKQSLGPILLFILLVISGFASAGQVLVSNAAGTCTSGMSTPSASLNASCYTTPTNVYNSTTTQTVLTGDNATLGPDTSATITTNGVEMPCLLQASIDSKTCITSFMIYNVYPIYLASNEMTMTVQIDNTGQWNSSVVSGGSGFGIGVWTGGTLSNMETFTPNFGEFFFHNNPNCLYPQEVGAPPPINFVFDITINGGGIASPLQPTCGTAIPWNIEAPNILRAGPLGNGYIGYIGIGIWFIGSECVTVSGGPTGTPTNCNAPYIVGNTGTPWVCNPTSTLYGESGVSGGGTYPNCLIQKPTSPIDVTSASAYSYNTNTVQLTDYGSGCYNTGTNNAGTCSNQNSITKYNRYGSKILVTNSYATVLTSSLATATATADSTTTFYTSTCSFQFGWPPYNCFQGQTTSVLTSGQSFSYYTYGYSSTSYVFPFPNTNIIPNLDYYTDLNYSIANAPPTVSLGLFLNGQIFVLPVSTQTFTAYVTDTGTPANLCTGSCNGLNEAMYAFMLEDLAPISALILLPMLVFFISFRSLEMTMVGATIGVIFATDAGYVPLWVNVIIMLGIAFFIIREYGGNIMASLTAARRSSEEAPSE